MYRKGEFAGDNPTRFVGDITVTDILTNELENVIRDFYDGGFYEAWTYRAMKKHDP